MPDIRTQRINITANPATQLTPSFVGMLYLDSSNILRADTVGNGTEGDFLPIIPEHKIDGQHGPQVNITQDSASPALVVTQNFASTGVSVAAGSTASGTALSIASASNTSRGFNLTMSGDADAAQIVANGTGRALVTDNGDVEVGNGNLIVNTDRLFVSTTRVGIGTASPDRLFDVNGSAAFRGNHIFITNPAAPIGVRSWGFVIGTAGGNLNIGPTSDTLPGGGILSELPLIIEHAQTEAEVVRITGEGTVGIGTASPASAKLEVQQDAGGTNVGILVDKNAGTGAAVQIDNSGAGNDITGTGSTWSVDNLGNAIFNSVTATLNQTIVTLSWTSDATSKSTGALGFTPRYAVILFAGHVGTTNQAAMSVGFATGVGTGVAVAVTDNQGAGTVDHTVGYDTSVPAGLPGINLGFETSFSRGQIDVTAFSSSGITLDPDVAVTGVAHLLIVE